MSRFAILLPLLLALLSGCAAPAWDLPDVRDAIRIGDFGPAQGAVSPGSSPTFTTVTANTSVLSPVFDTATAIPLDIGPTNATAVNYGKAAGGIAHTFNGAAGTDVTILDGVVSFGTHYATTAGTTTLAAETAQQVFSVTMGDGDFSSINITATIRASDAADDASVETVRVQITLIDMAGGAVSAGTPGVVSSILDVGSSVLTKGVWTVTTTDDQSIEINVASVVTGITQTNHEINWQVSHPANVSITAAP